MPGVTEQEIAQAKQMNLYQYMQLCEPDNFKPEGPGQFRHKGHSSLTFAADGSWTYFKTKATGRTALNYLMAVEGVSFVEAVREINRIQGGVRPSFQPVKAPPPPAEKKPAKEFRLPKPDKNNYAATAYLRKRCIHPNVLTFCKQKRILYQTSFKDHPNCVFVGRDGNGEPKGGSLRGCSQIQFRRDIPGSKKIYPFYIEAAANADTVEVYEAPIDAMSGASLKIMQHTGNWRGVHYLALGGTDYAALDAFLTYYPNITHIVLCLDNDEAGRTRTQDIACTLIYQSLNQLKSQYKDDWATIYENCDSMIVLGAGGNPENLEFFSKALGKATIEVMNTSENKGSQGSYTKSYQALGRELMTPEEIRTMPRNWCLLMISGVAPFYSRKYNLKDHPNYHLVEAEGGKPFDYDRRAEQSFADFISNVKDVKTVKLCAENNN